MAHDHSELLKKIKKDMPADEQLQDLGDLFKIFGDTTRIKIMYALYEGEMCVCAISELLNMTQSAISHQLKTLNPVIVKIRFPPSFLQGQMLHSMASCPSGSFCMGPRV